MIESTPKLVPPKNLKMSKILGKTIQTLVNIYEPPEIDLDKLDKFCNLNNINSASFKDKYLIFYNAGLPKFRVYLSDACKYTRLSLFQGLSYIHYETADSQRIFLQVCDEKGLPLKVASSKSESIESLTSNLMGHREVEKSLSLKQIGQWAIWQSIQVVTFISKNLIGVDNLSVVASDYRQIGQNLFSGIEIAVKNGSINAYGLFQGRPRIMFNTNILNDSSNTNQVPISKKDMFVKVGQQVYLITYARNSSSKNGKIIGEVREDLSQPQLVKVNLPVRQDLGISDAQSLYTWLASIPSLESTDLRASGFEI